MVLAVSDQSAAALTAGLPQLYRAVEYDQSDIIESCHPLCELHSTVCCDNDGIGSRPGCHSGTFSSASAVCSELGLRLCSVQQLQQAGARSTECGAQTKRIWSRDACAGAVLRFFSGCSSVLCAAGSAESSCRQTLSCAGLQECFDDSGYYHEGYLIRAPDWTAIVCLICAGILPWVAGCIVVACLPIFFPKTRFSLSSLLLCGNTAKCQSCCRANHYTVHNRQEFEAALEQHAEQVQRLELAVQQEIQRIVLQVTDGEKQVSISVHPESTGADVASQLNVKEGIAIIFADNVINPTASLSSCGIVEGGLLHIESRMNVRQDQSDVVSTCTTSCKCPNSGPCR